MPTMSKVAHALDSIGPVAYKTQTTLSTLPHASTHARMSSRFLVDLRSISIIDVLQCDKFLFINMILHSKKLSFSKCDLQKCQKLKNILCRIIRRAIDYLAL